MGGRAVMDRSGERVYNWAVCYNNCEYYPRADNAYEHWTWRKLTLMLLSVHW